MNQINFSAELEDIKARKDRTLSIKLSTQELSKDDTAYIFDLFNKPIFIGMAETDIKKLEIPDSAVEFASEKSPSKRFKDRLFVYWKHTKGQGDFEGWYRATLEDLGNKYLDKIDNGK